MHRVIWLIPALALLAACNKGPDAAKKGAAPATALLVSAEDLHTVKNSALASGPSLTGSVQPERRADLRAEVQAVVVQVLKENGDTVRRGDLLVRLDDNAIRDGLVLKTTSANDGVVFIADDEEGSAPVSRFSFGNLR